MPRGGKRKGAGRPKGSGKFGELTKAVRLPVSKIRLIMEFLDRKGLCYPIYSNHECKNLSEVPSQTIELGSFLIENPDTAFFLYADGNVMSGAGIFHNDILVIDKGTEPTNGDIVAAYVNGEFLVRRLFVTDRKAELRAEAKHVESIIFDDIKLIDIKGVVKRVIHKV